MTGPSRMSSTRGSTLRIGECTPARRHELIIVRVNGFCTNPHMLRWCRGLNLALACSGVVIGCTWS